MKYYGKLIVDRRGYKNGGEIMGRRLGGRVLLDLILTLATGGLWLLVLLIRFLKKNS